MKLKNGVDVSCGCHAANSMSVQFGHLSAMSWQV